MTGRASPRQAFRLMAPVLCWASLGSPLGGCDEDQYAGTSVGTGNPGVVTLGFTSGSAAARLSGKVALYAADHNPLIDSQPLASFAVADRDSLRLDQESLLSRLPGARPDTPFTLNVLLRTEDGRGAWHPGLAFALRSGRLHSLHPDARVQLSVVPLDSFRGALGTEDVEGERRYVTVFGSPFFARASACGFAMDSIPWGRYQARLVRFLEGAPVVGDVKLSPVHALDDSLDTRGARALSPLPEMIGTVPLPPEGPRAGP